MMMIIIIMTIMIIMIIMIIMMMINIYICSHDDYYNSFTPLLGTIGFPLLQHLRSRGLQGAGCCL